MASNNKEKRKTTELHISIRPSEGFNPGSGPPLKKTFYPLDTVDKIEKVNKFIDFLNFYKLHYRTIFLKSIWCSNLYKF